MLLTYDVIRPYPDCKRCGVQMTPGTRYCVELTIHAACVSGKDIENAEKTATDTARR